MKELKNLSVKSIDIKKIIDLNGNMEDKIILNEEFPQLSVRGKADAEHFMVTIQGKDIPCSKSSNVEIRKITAGALRGLYLFIEKTSIGKNRTSVYLLHEDGALPLSETNKVLDMIDIDTLADKEYVACLTACKLNTFDLGQENQSYKYFCQKLPKRLFENKKLGFADLVIKNFFAGEINLIPNKNNRFVNTQLCKAEAYEFFDEFVCKTEREIEMGE